MKKLFLIILPAIALLYACGTIIHGTSQPINISSTPSRAKVYINEQIIGKTPTFVTLSRAKNHTLRIELPGYHPYETALTMNISGWAFGNIVFGLIPGFVVDSLTGGLYRLTPEQVQAEMQEAKVSESSNPDHLFIGVVLEPNPEWEKVGNLKEINLN